MSVDEASNPALADLLLGYKLCEVLDHSPCRRTESLCESFNVLYKLLILWVDKSLFECLIFM
jgi:hypothetical protein